MRCPKVDEEIANSADTDQTAPIRSSLTWVYTVHSEIIVQVCRVIMIHVLIGLLYSLDYKGQIKVRQIKNFSSYTLIFAVGFL